MASTTAFKIPFAPHPIHEDIPSTPESLMSNESTPSPMSDHSSAPSSLFLTPISRQSQSLLLRSPSEILHRVLCNSGTEDLPAIARAAKTCRELRSFIYENPDQALWRDIHLRRFDDPRTAGAFVHPRAEFDWKKRVQDREFVARIFREWPEERFEELADHLDLICSTLLDMYLDLPASGCPSNTAPSFAGYEETNNGHIIESILRSDAFQYIYLNLSTRETKPLLRPLRAQPGNPNRRSHKEVVNPHLSRLHVLLSPDFNHDIIVHRQHRGYLREVVYSASNFQQRNDWGPFTEDGKVDWTLVDAIGSVMMANAKDVLSMGEDGWRQAVLPLSYGLETVRCWGYNDLRRPASLAQDEIWDWAGVQGPWCGSYAFLDYADWISLNEPRLVQLRRSMNQLDLSRYSEAIGDLMRLDLVIDKDASSATKAYAQRQHHAADDLHAVSTHLPTSDLLPPIHFHGSSVQHNGATTYPSQSPASFVRGVVRLTADDPPQVRWTLVIRYGGEDRWRLEGVQVGGRGAKRGFFGVWTDAMKEEHSPNGPVWYWKP
ncbi:MAG: hypothetical protein TREMPRED_001257 [Tremellales sp. Tagirdzhanova-0007]|nr:MAG: hypothetical protein TREMPRED_001257 [Tremellales sp. Tagirdzhanova-0007]